MSITSHLSTSDDPTSRRELLAVPGFLLVTAAPPLCGTLPFARSLDARG